jgi:hypothetical protein
MSYSEYLGKYTEQQKENETILEKCMTIICVDFEEEGDLDIWEQENEITNHNPDQYLPDPLDSEDGCVLFCIEK